MRVSRLISVAVVLCAGNLSAVAEVRQLSESAGWAAHGGTLSDGRFICALVAGAANVALAQLVVEYQAGRDGLLLRLVKPTWKIEKNSRRPVDISFSYGDPRRIDMMGTGTELAVWLPSPQAHYVVDRLSTQSLTIAFPAGNEPSWSIAPGGEGIIEPDWRRCIAMSAAEPEPPPSQP